MSQNIMYDLFTPSEVSTSLKGDVQINDLL